MQDIWWNKITRARNFIDSIVNALEQYNNVVLGLPQHVPWYDNMRSIIDRDLGNAFGDRNIREISCPEGDVGKYLLDNFCKKEKRAAYRGNKSYATFLAESTDIVLNSYIIWVTDISEEKLSEWIAFVSDYNKHMSADASPALFVLETGDSVMVKACKHVRWIMFSNEISAYDKFVFCMLAGSSYSMENPIRQYFAEMIASICSDDVELCGACIGYGKSFLEDPVSCLKTICDTERRSDSSAFEIDIDEQKIDNLIWECQVKIVFPAIEKYRNEFVKRHYKEISSVLPIENSYGESIDIPEDAEIGLLYHMTSFMGAIQMRDNNEFPTLKAFYNARNSLAHLRPMTFAETEFILKTV